MEYNELDEDDVDADEMRLMLVGTPQFDIWMNK